MGVNQYTSHHTFQPLADGGRIELQRDVNDSVGIARIRTHMHQIAAQFAGGDFRLPGFVHAQAVPGTGVMAAKRGAITYTVESLPRGAPCACAARMRAPSRRFTSSWRFNAKITGRRPTTIRSGAARAGGSTA